MMKKLTYLKSLLLLCALIVGAGNSWAQELTVDFEKETSDYTDWTFTTIVTKQTNSNVTAHGGSYFGTTNGKTSGSIVTKEKIASPQSIRFYISKTSTNTTASSWLVQVSEDGEEWTQVGDSQSASAGITKGKWTEVSRDLTSYSDVYVGVFYDGTTAVRAIDDITLTYTGASKTDVTLVVEDLSMYVGQEKAVTDLYLIVDDYAGEVTFGSSNEAVAKVEDDVLKAVAAGTATITVTAAADANYKMATETFTVTVKSKDVAPEGAAVCRFVKVTDTSDVTDGEYLIVYEGNSTHASVAFNGGLKTLDASNNGIAVTIAEGVIVGDASTVAATFTWDSSAKTLTSKSGVLIGNSSYSNALKYTGTNTIEIDDDGNAVITAVESKNGDDYTTLRYNYASDNLRFRYYKSGQQDIQLYKLTESSTFDIEMGTTGYRTIVSAQDVTLPEGLTAYVVSANAEGKATLQQVDGLVANEPYILMGDAGTYTLTISDAVSAPSLNLLQISDESTGNGVYVLAKRSGIVGFYKWNGGLLGAGRVYLPASSLAAEYEFISLDGDAIETGINAVDSELKANGEVYNLNGQRVAQPTKGLYIVNGKKVVMK